MLIDYATREGGVTRVAVLNSAVYMFVHMGERGRRCSAVYIETHRRTRAAVLRDVYIHAYEYK